MHVDDLGARVTHVVRLLMIRQQSCQAVLGLGPVHLRFLGNRAQLRTKRRGILRDRVADNNVARNNQHQNGNNCGLAEPQPSRHLLGELLILCLHLVHLLLHATDIAAFDSSGMKSNVGRRRGRSDSPDPPESLTDTTTQGCLGHEETCQNHPHCPAATGQRSGCDGTEIPNNDVSSGSIRGR